MPERNVAWISIHDLRGYTRKHKIHDLPEGKSVHDAYRDGTLKTKCGTKIPNHVTDITEDAHTFECGRCYR